MIDGVSDLNGLHFGETDCIAQSLSVSPPYPGSAMIFVDEPRRGTLKKKLRFAWRHSAKKRNGHIPKGGDMKKIDFQKFAIGPVGVMIYVDSGGTVVGASPYGRGMYGQGWGKTMGRVSALDVDRSPDETENDPKVGRALAEKALDPKVREEILSIVNAY